ncbi:unnamed protein product, partial [Laminaria digitata]
MYDLACVLYHKGTNVHSGHYIAEVHDPDSNTWTLFDDEKVRPLSRVNSHGSVGRKAATSITNSTGKGSAAGGLEKMGSRNGENDGDFDAAAAESDADADLLGSGVKADDSDGVVGGAVNNTAGEGKGEGEGEEEGKVEGKDAKGKRKGKGEGEGGGESNGG